MRALIAMACERLSRVPIALVPIVLAALAPQARALDVPASLAVTPRVAVQSDAAAGSSSAPTLGGEANALAVDAYRRGDLATARTAWIQALSATGEHGPLGDDERARIAYDLGNVAFREQKTLEAVGWYTASLRLRPRDADTWANLEHARREAGLEPADRGDLSSTLARIIGALTPRESEHLALGGVLALAATLFLEAWFGTRAARRGVLGGVLVFAVCSVPWLAHALKTERDPLLSIAPRGKPLTLQSEPRSDAAPIAELASGDVAERLDELPDWTRVELENGTQGWVRSSGVFALRR